MVFTTREKKQKSKFPEVGRNGAGKTGGVSGMAADVKTLHVKPEARRNASRGSRGKLGGVKVDY